MTANVCVGLAVVFFANGLWNYRRVLTAARDVIEWLLAETPAQREARDEAMCLVYRDNDPLL